jgi:hypothetical protein
VQLSAVTVVERTRIFQASKQEGLIVIEENATIGHIHG